MQTKGKNGGGLGTRLLTVRVCHCVVHEHCSVEILECSTHIPGPVQILMYAEPEPFLSTTLVFILTLASSPGPFEKSEKAWYPPFAHALN